jgi:hypothetical protein
MYASSVLELHSSALSNKIALLTIIIKKTGMMVEQGLVVVYKKIKEECSLT